jgi:hypothetical protein
MANWMKLAKELLLADGTIDRRETDLLRKEILADGKADDGELEFLLDLKRSAAAVSPSYQQLVFDAVKSNVLADGVISAQEASWLRRWVMSEGQIDEATKKLFQELKAGARQAVPEFEVFYQQIMSR